MHVLERQYLPPINTFGGGFFGKEMLHVKIRQDVQIWIWTYCIHEIIPLCENFTIFTVRANQWKCHAEEWDFIIGIYTKRAQSVKISCSEIICNLKSVKFSWSENLMNYSICKHWIWLYQRAVNFWQWTEGRFSFK